MTPRFTRTLLFSIGIAIFVTAIYHWIIKEGKDSPYGQKIIPRLYTARITVELGQAHEAAQQKQDITQCLNILQERFAEAGYEFVLKRENTNHFLFSFDKLKDTTAIPFLFMDNGRLAMYEVYTMDALTTSFLNADNALAQVFLGQPEDTLSNKDVTNIDSMRPHPLLRVVNPARPFEQEMKYPGYMGMISPSDTALARRLLEHPATARYWPADLRFLYEQTNTPTNPYGLTLVYAIKNHPPIISNRHIVHAEAIVDNVTKEPLINLEFDAFGAREFEKLTTRNIGKPLAICINDQVIMAPIVNMPIAGGHIRITMGGDGSREEALTRSRMLGILLTGEELPLPVQITQASFTPFNSPKSGIRDYVMLFLLAFALALGIQWLIIRLNAPRGKNTPPDSGKDAKL
jgi:preprotein translocase subunit SecD